MGMSNSAATSGFASMVQHAPSGSFISEEALHLKDTWSTSVYSSLCFERKRWLLLVQQRAGLPPSKSFGSAAFQRYPLQVQVVPNRSAALAERKARCWKPGTTFVADLRHGGGATMGIAHFAKRVLRLHGLQQQSSAYGLPAVDRIAFPATSAAHLAHSWPSSMLKLVSPRAAEVPVDELTGHECCYETVVAAARENTYFVRRGEQDVLREAAYALAGVPPARAPCAPVSVCYFQRSEGKPGGRWEGGARVIVNRRELLRLMQLAIDKIVPGGLIRLVNINSTHTFAQQVALFASCDVMASYAHTHTDSNPGPSSSTPPPSPGAFERRMRALHPSTPRSEPPVRTPPSRAGYTAHKTPT